ncbi:hypothetical protein A0H81_09110 [Grifola frondosa]|uniref:Uncharacterized protein n=1 Tax=Grifola frondosa TaxID=5627 RepID=A0A1C7M7D4_GRIFR|nr:hypothetical protein A0H81_09110 [Grifola frondosa]
MFHLAYLLIFITGVWTSPLAEAWTGPAQRKDFKVNLRRSINRTTSLQGTENVGVFDPTYAKKELNAILIKYANASRFLDGIGLNPDTHPEGGYPPFTVPTVSELNTTCASDSAAPVLPRDCTEDEASTIIGVPGVAPGTAIMPLQDDVSGTLDILY